MVIGKKCQGREITTDECISCQPSYSLNICLLFLPLVQGLIRL